MEDYTFKSIIDEIITNMKKQVKKLEDTMDTIINMDSKNDINEDDIEKLNNVSDNLYNAIENMNDFYLMISNNDIDMSVEERLRLKNIKNNLKINKMFMPYMMLMKIKLDNYN
jgi:hypothetical protein